MGAEEVSAPFFPLHLCAEESAPLFPLHWFSGSLPASACFFFFKTPMVNFLDSVDSFLVACWNFQKGYSCDLFASSSGGFKKFLSHWFNQSSQVFHVLSHPRAREREQRTCCRPWRSGVLEESLVSRQSVFVLPSELVVYSFWPRFLEATSG